MYYLTELRPPTRFVSNFPLMAAWGPQEWKGELINDLKKSPPAYIVVARHDELFGVTYTEMDSEQSLKLFPQLDGFISDFYHPVAEFPDFLIYRRVGGG